MSGARKILIALIILIAVGAVVGAMVFLRQSYSENPFTGATAETRMVNRATDASELELASQVVIGDASVFSQENSLFLPESSEPVEESSEPPIEVPDIQQLINSIKEGTYRPTIKLVGTDKTEDTYKNPIVEPVENDEPDPDTSDDTSRVKIDQYKLHIHVTDTDGHAIANAKVMLEKDTFYTGSDGSVEATTKLSAPMLVVSSPNRAAYYEELDLVSEEMTCDIILANAANMQTMINSQDLHPYVTNDEEINRYIEALLSDLTDSSMDTYTKVLKCYEYMIRSTYYKSPSHWKRPYRDYYWSCGYQCLCEGYGTCNCYSAAFTLMMRRIGLECFVVEGYTTSSKGGYTSHEWTVILMGGQYY
ncbi:MAG: transglutaminase domain-containing protein, partial [Clostridia bacterium]|nr:transglutaminase domain-containing protein [Clostridia bacterium]